VVRMACELVGVAGFEPVASSSRTEHTSREMCCARMFPQLRGSKSGAITASDRACQCLTAPVLLPAGKQAGTRAGGSSTPSPFSYLPERCMGSTLDELAGGV